MYSTEWIIENSKLIVNQYAFLRNSKGFIVCINLNSDKRAEFSVDKLQISSTTMDDIEINIVLDILSKYRENL